MNNASFDNWCMVKYYIFVGLFRLVWCLAALGFTYLTVMYFKTPWCLLFAGLVFLNPTTTLNLVKTTLSKSSTDDSKHNPSDYGTNNPL